MKKIFVSAASLLMGLSILSSCNNGGSPTRATEKEVKTISDTPEYFFFVRNWRKNTAIHTPLKLVTTLKYLEQ
jgi:hypothetical protein